MINLEGFDILQQSKLTNTNQLANQPREMVRAGNLPI